MWRFVSLEVIRLHRLEPLNNAAHDAGTRKFVLYMFTYMCTYKNMQSQRINSENLPMLRVIDLFSGAGGMSLGLVDQRFCGGFESILALDNDASAIETHKSNFSGQSLCANIEDWIIDNEVPEADLVIGGPPCQGFSLLNKKRDGDQRRALWEPFIEVTHLSGARMFLMENVAELFRSPELQDISAKAAEYGFDTKACIVNSADYGAPQKRNRTIILGWKSGLQPPAFPPLATHAAPNVDSCFPSATMRQTA